MTRHRKQCQAGGVQVLTPEMEEDEETAEMEGDEAKADLSA